MASTPNELTDAEKFCPGCEIVKSAEHFNKAADRRGGLRAWCKVCERQKSRETLAVMKERVFAKLTQECVRCGFNDKRALQIDHINGGGTTEARLFSNRMSYLKKVLADQTGKYQILCANCNWIKRAELDEQPPVYEKRVAYGS